MYMSWRSDKSYSAAGRCNCCNVDSWSHGHSHSHSRQCCNIYKKNMLLVL